MNNNTVNRGVFWKGLGYIHLKPVLSGTNNNSRIPEDLFPLLLEASLKEYESAQEYRWKKDPGLLEILCCNSYPFEHRESSLS